MSEDNGEEVKGLDYFARMSLCGDCEHFTRTLKFSKCNLCGCLLALKAKKKG